MGIFLMFLVVSGLKAQDFKLGWQLGGSLTQVDGDNLSGYNKFGPHVGLFVERSIGKLSLRPEFLFTVKGAKNYVNPDNIQNPLKSAFYYAEVPLFLNYRQKKWQAELGGSFGVLIWAYNRDNTGRYTTTASYNRLEWAGHLGASYFVRTDLGVYVRYSYSLDCVDGGNCGKLFTSPKLRPGYFHNVVSFGLRGYFNT